MARFPQRSFKVWREHLQKRNRLRDTIEDNSTHNVPSMTPDIDIRFSFFAKNYSVVGSML
jgi:hypothetical protein